MVLCFHTCAFLLPLCHIYILAINIHCNLQKTRSTLNYSSSLKLPNHQTNGETIRGQWYFPVCSRQLVVLAFAGLVLRAQQQWCFPLRQKHSLEPQSDCIYSKDTPHLISLRKIVASLAYFQKYLLHILRILFLHNTRLQYPCRHLL